MKPSTGPKSVKRLQAHLRFPTYPGQDRRYGGQGGCYGTLIYRSAWVKDVQDIRVTRESSMAKLYGTEAAQEVIDQAANFRGTGVVSGVPVERFTEKSEHLNLRGYQ